MFTPDISRPQSKSTMNVQPYAKENKSKTRPIQIIQNTDPLTFDIYDHPAVKKQIRQNVIRSYLDQEQHKILEQKRARAKFLALKKTKKWKKRPDLLVKRSFTEENMKYEETLISTKNVQEMLDKTNLVADNALLQM